MHPHPIFMIDITWLNINNQWVELAVDLLNLYFLEPVWVHFTKVEELLKTFQLTKALYF